MAKFEIFYCDECMTERRTNKAYHVCHFCGRDLCSDHANLVSNRLDGVYLCNACVCTPEAEDLKSAAARIDDLLKQGQAKHRPSLGDVQKGETGA